MEALTLNLTEVVKRQNPKSKKGFNQVRAPLSSQPRGPQPRGLRPRPGRVQVPEGVRMREWMRCGLGCVLRGYQGRKESPVGGRVCVQRLPCQGPRAL